MNEDDQSARVRWDDQLAREAMWQNPDVFLYMATSPRYLNGAHLAPPRAKELLLLPARHEQSL